MYDSWVGSSTIVEGDFRPVLQIGKYHNRKVLESKGCAHARAHGTRAMNGGRQVHYFFFGITASTSLCSNGLQRQTRARTRKFPCLFFFQCFFITISFTSFFLSNFRSFCTEWSKGEQQGKYAKEKSHFLAIIFCSSLECM